MNRIGLLLGAVLVAALASPFVAGAQTTPPRLFLSWRTDAYVPADYPGRSFPTANSALVLSAALHADGRFLNSDQVTLRGYVDGNLYQAGPGLHTVILRAPAVPRGRVEIRAEAQAGDVNVSKTVEVPVRSPEAVIAGAYPGNVFRQSAYFLRARPFFFNVAAANRLTFSWRVDGASPHNPEGQ